MPETSTPHHDLKSQQSTVGIEVAPTNAEQASEAPWIDQQLADLAKWKQDQQAGTKGWVADEREENTNWLARVSEAKQTLDEAYSPPGSPSPEQPLGRPIAMRFGESPIAEPHTPTEVAADNMYRTFWYAQGEPGLDRALSELTKYQYARDWSSTDWQAARGHVGDTEDEAFRQLGIPRKHVDPRGGVNTKSYKDTVRDEFELRWRGLGYTFDEDQTEAARRTQEALEENVKSHPKCDFS